jgi:alpha,alpha-trehalase
MNRYWDDADVPREESHAEDILLASRTAREPAGLYRDIRAACESGWDFSSRWLADGVSMATICTTGILPVDLNALMYRLETVLSTTCEAGGDQRAAVYYRDRALKRRAMLQSAFFDADQGLFVDLYLDDRHPSGALSLASAYPLFFGIATEKQAARVADRIERDFLAPGGWVTTLTTSGQQWDAPIGWAPLQWIVFRGLRNYGFDDAARSGATRWIDNVIGKYRSTGRLLEKYDVVQPGRTATGGEYAVQDGFGWTNGVLLSLMKDTGRSA